MSKGAYHKEVIMKSQQGRGGGGFLKGNNFWGTIAVPYGTDK